MESKQKQSSGLGVQSNLCTTTTLGTQEKWSLFKGGCYLANINIIDQKADFFN